MDFLALTIMVLNIVGIFLSSLCTKYHVIFYNNCIIVTKKRKNNLLTRDLLS